MKNHKPLYQTILISVSLVICLFGLNYYVAGIGRSAGQYLANNNLIKSVVEVVRPPGVWYIFPTLLYEVIAFLAGSTVVIFSFWEVFLKDPKTGLFVQMTPDNFVRHLPYFLSIGFFWGFSAVLAEIIIVDIEWIARLLR